MKFKFRPSFNIPAIAALLASLVGSALIFTPAHATSIVVTTAADIVASDGFCSLREAIQAANTDMAVNECPAGFGSDNISFDTPYTITLDGGLGALQPSTDMTIDGNNTAGFIIQASTCDPTSAIPGCTTATNPVFLITAGSLTLYNMTVRYGASLGQGGGIYKIGGSLWIQGVLDLEEPCRNWRRRHLQW